MRGKVDFLCSEWQSGRPLMSRKLNKMIEQLVRNWQWGM